MPNHSKLTFTDHNTSLVVEYFIPDVISGPMAGAAFLVLAPSAVVGIPLGLARFAWQAVIPIVSIAPAYAYASHEQKGVEFSYEVDRFKFVDGESIQLGDGLSFNISTQSDIAAVDLNLHSSEGVTANWQTRFLSTRDVDNFLRSDIDQGGSVRYGIMTTQPSNNMSTFYYVRRGEDQISLPLLGTGTRSGIWVGSETVYSAEGSEDTTMAPTALDPNDVGLLSPAESSPTRTPLAEVITFRGGVNSTSELGLALAAARSATSVALAQEMWAREQEQQHHRDILVMQGITAMCMAIHSGDSAHLFNYALQSGSNFLLQQNNVPVQVALRRVPIYSADGPTVLRDEVVNGERVRVTGDGHQDILDIMALLHYFGIPTSGTISLPVGSTEYTSTMRSRNNGLPYSTHICFQDGAIDYVNKAVGHIAPNFERSQIDIVMMRQEILEKKRRFCNLYKTHTTHHNNLGFQVDTTVTNRYEAWAPSLSWDGWTPQLVISGHVHYTTETKEFSEATKIERSTQLCFGPHSYDEPELFDTNANEQRSYSKNVIVDHEVTYSRSFFGSYSHQEQSTQVWESRSPGSNSDTQTFESSSSIEALHFSTVSTARTTENEAAEAPTTTSGILMILAHEEGSMVVTNHNNRGNCTLTRSSVGNHAARKEYSDGSWSETGIDCQVNSTTTRTSDRIITKTKVTETHYQSDAKVDCDTSTTSLAADGGKKITVRLEKNIDSETEKGYFMNETKTTTTTKDLDSGDDVGDAVDESVSTLNRRTAKGMATALSSVLNLIKKYFIDNEAAKFDDMLQPLGVMSESLMLGQFGEVVDNHLCGVSDRSQFELMSAFGVACVALSYYRNYRGLSTRGRIVERVVMTSTPGYNVQLLEHLNQPTIFVSLADVKTKLAHDKSMFVGRAVVMADGRTGTIQKHQFTTSYSNDVYTIQLTSKGFYGDIVPDIEGAQLQLLENLNDELQVRDYVRFYSSQKRNEAVEAVVFDVLSAAGQAVIVYVSNTMITGTVLIYLLQLLITSARLGIKFWKGEVTLAQWLGAIPTTATLNAINLCGGLGGGAIVYYAYGAILNPVYALIFGVGASYFGSLSLSYMYSKSYMLLERQLYWWNYRCCARKCGLIVGILGSTTVKDSMWASMRGVHPVFTDKDIATCLKYRRFKCSSSRGLWNADRTERISYETATVLDCSYTYLKWWCTYTLSFNSGRDIWYDFPHSQLDASESSPFSVGAKVKVRFKHSDALDLQTMQEFERLCHYRHYFGHSAHHSNGKITLFAYLSTTLGNMINPTVAIDHPDGDDVPKEDPFDELVWTKRLEALNEGLASPQSYFDREISVNNATSTADGIVAGATATFRRLLSLSQIQA